MFQSTKLSPLLVLAFCMALCASACYGFSHSHTHTHTHLSSRIRTTASSSSSSSSSNNNSPLWATVIDAPTKEDLERKVGRRKGGNSNDNDDPLGDAVENIEEAIRQQGPLEWLEDNPDESRDMEDPFHILILDTTYEKPKITVPYVASNLEYVLQMPIDDATEHSQFCFDHGMSCVGVWPREECLQLGRQLQLRDIVCRIVPFTDGGHRAWQAGEAADAADVSRFLD